MGLLIGIWLSSAVLAAGFFNAYEKKEWARYYDVEDLVFSIGLGLVGGPISLLVTFFMCDFWKEGWTLSRVICTREALVEVHDIPLPDFIRERAAGKMLMQNGKIYKKELIKVKSWHD